MKTLHQIDIHDTHCQGGDTKDGKVLPCNCTAEKRIEEIQLLVQSAIPEKKDDSSIYKEAGQAIYNQAIDEFTQSLREKGLIK